MDLVVEDRRGADAYQPQLTLWGHLWRILVMVAISAATAVDLYQELWDDRRWRVALDVALGLAAFALVFLRRRHPFAVALAVLVLATFSATAAGPAVLATVSIATRRVAWQLGVIAALTFVSTPVYEHITGSTEPVWLMVALSAAITLALLGWGMYIGSRRELLWSLRHRAERAEAERDVRAGKARSDERARIAREMHDVLAHRISQISMHAGALAFRDDLDAAALREGITDVQVRANEALADLRSVLGVLRDPETGLVSHRPQPTYDDLPELVDACRATGTRVELDDRIATRPVPVALGRTLYRIIQEGITNATKHAPGARLEVYLTGGSDTGVDVVLQNPLGLGQPAAPGAGLGLVGLRERIELAGGQLRHGLEGRAFVVRASLPWAS